MFEEGILLDSDFNPILVWFELLQSWPASGSCSYFNPILVWFELCNLDISSLTISNFNPILVWFEPIKLVKNDGSVVEKGISIPFWSDLNEQGGQCGGKGVALISIPFWSDLNEELDNGRRRAWHRINRIKFQSHFGLIWTNQYVRVLEDSVPYFNPILVWFKHTVCPPTALS